MSLKKYNDNNKISISKSVNSSVILDKNKNEVKRIDFDHDYTNNENLQIISNNRFSDVKNLKLRFEEFNENKEKIKIKEINQLKINQN